ncbi:MAG: ComEA family DNA-binding protein [Acutalibacteraceae bacterium]
MRERSAERVLLAVGLLVVAAVIAYQTAKTPSLFLEGSTPTFTAYTAAEKSRYAVNVNAATVEELAGVKYITETMAENIVSYRTQNGRFYAESELLNVPGIGEVTLEKIRPYITLD